MAGGAKLDDEEGFNEINVVPLVDIMLVLLIIFLVTTEFVDKEEQYRPPPNVPLQLPRASTAVDSPNKNLLSVVMNKEGDLYLNGEKSSLDGIKARVAELKARGEKLEAFVAADERLTHGAVLTVVDTLRLLGVADVAINTKPMEIE
ncbi:MAG: biopolymer transporter ExbD [Myxococcota bacterium]